VVGPKASPEVARSPRVEVVVSNLVRDSLTEGVRRTQRRTNRLPPLLLRRQET
jgi:hypothetical protein